MRRVALLTDRQQIPLLVPASFLSMQESPPTENGLAGFNAARTNSRRSGALRYNAIEYGCHGDEAGWNLQAQLPDDLAAEVLEHAATADGSHFLASR
ncbi:hypothetical protein [Burkholderia ubonensis]|uniref:hypothetical protein n=1 Tax=Burkholderia ubonensis TaxID=101571 RepID=UPI002AB2BC29|nr:hypothetical protein [Burkholderia ubonensis]